MPEGYFYFREVFFMELHELIRMFAVEGSITDISEYGNGHINRTYRVRMNRDGKLENYILQQINTHIFKNVDQLMENITGVTGHLKRKILQAGGDPSRETLQIIPARNGKSYYRSGERCYRMYPFISHTYSYDCVEKPEDFYESALAFGKFQSLLSDYPAETLHETIPDFHHTGKRFETFCEAVRSDTRNRAGLADPEIRFVMERSRQMNALTSLLEQKALPLRVTHNDTKLNNILIDDVTGKGICIIDLDTVMPGLSAYDFGDAIRFGANTAAEDETDLSKVSLDMDLYELYVKGYLEGCGQSLTQKELEMLPVGAKLMTLECGMRFLTDYLCGDVYFRIHKEHHNLDRCRTQFALVADMERKWTQMNALVQQAVSRLSQSVSEKSFP